MGALMKTGVVWYTNTGMKTFIIKNLKRILFLLSIVITILIGALIGIILVYQKGFPQIENLEDIKPKVMTVIYDDQGESIKEFAIEKRTIVRRQDIPDVLVNAIIASEDNQFYSHWGINFKGTLRAILGELTRKNLGGGSSITQQLALNYFLDRDRTWGRKFQEMLMAIQIEKKYSKDQILTAYCNKIYLGASVYGVEAASRYYFGKSVQEITLAEAALFPAIMPSPNGKYSVFNRPKSCLIKRNYILKQMLEMTFIDEKQYQEAIKVPLPTKPHEIEVEEIGDYFVEDTRKLIESKFGDNRLYTGGLKVYTTLNSEMQTWAETALREGLRNHDKRRGWRGGLTNLLKKKKPAAGETPPEKEPKKIDIETHQLPAWKRLKIEKNKLLDGIVLDVSNRRAIIRIGPHKGILDASGARWTRRPLRSVLKKGDIAVVKVTDIKGSLEPPAKETDKKETDKKKKPVKYPLKFTLEQHPLTQGAILVVENKTGEIKAMVGGYAFEKSQWNNATQAKRQTGSTIKPIVYSAAIENGYTPTTIVVDEPTIFDNQWTQEPYEPQNHTEDFRGPLTLRRGFEQSRNLISAKVVEYLTPPRVVQYARNFGITADLRPYMSIALGAFEVTLKEMVAVFTVFPNLGIRVAPFMVRKIIDHNNHIIEENYPDKKKVLEKETAYIINYMMQGVVKYGTGARAKKLEAPIGGKTGTTDDFTDAWFIGFSPSISVGVWVGYDVKKNLGREETGGRTASPIFVNFMEKYLEKYPEPQEFKKPSGVILRKIDKYTGKIFNDECYYPFWEAFIRGTEPVDRCVEEDHQLIEGYYHDDLPPEEPEPGTVADTDPETGEGDPG